MIPHEPKPHLHFKNVRNLNRNEQKSFHKKGISEEYVKILIYAHLSLSAILFHNHFTIETLEYDIIMVSGAHLMVASALN